MSEKILFIKTHEDTEYYDYDGFSFGECSQLLDEDRSIDLHSIFGISSQLNMIGGITIVYCIERDNGTYIGTIFRNADIFRRSQFYDVDKRYFVRAKAEDVFVIPEKKRDQKVIMKGDYSYISSEKVSRYIEKTATGEYCVKFDKSIVEKGMKEAGNDGDKLGKLAEKVFCECEQTKEAEPVMKKWISVCKEAKETYLYATFLKFSNKFAEALKIYTKLYNDNPDDYYLINMAICNFYMGLRTETMVLFDKVEDKTKLEDFDIDYDYMKKTMPYISNAEYIDDREVLKYGVLIPFDDMKLPDIVKVDGVKKYFDPIRKKGVPITPEEKVRQQVLRYLLDVCHVPEEYITSEDSLAHYNIGTRLRADITVNVGWRTLLLVECKENNVGIEGDPLRQILEYNKTIRSRYLLLTNGIASFIYLSADDGSLTPLSDLPDFEDMCKSVGTTVPIKNITTERPDVSEFTHEEIQNYKNDGSYLGLDTPEELAPLVLNLAWFFLDRSYKIENIRGFGCKIVKDLGVINTFVSNASGGGFPGKYRQLLVRDRFGEEQILCFSVFGVLSGYTSLVCSIEINGKLTAKLEVRLDKCLSNVHGDKYTLEHNGVRSRRTIESMMSYVRKTCPKLIRNGKIFLGEIDNSKNITINSPGAKDFMARLVSYVILRKELSVLEAKNK